MLVELHSLTSHAPANLNRDDLGRPKSAIFGGTQRSRISSQAIKRSIRTSTYLAGILADRLSTRSRRIPRFIHDELLREEPGIDPKRLESACKLYTEVLGKPDPKKELMTKQIVFLTHGEIERSKAFIREIVMSDRKIDKELKESAPEKIGLNRIPGDGVDMALFGRMTTDEANAFAEVDAAMQVAHAISTHTVIPEVDWFTAVDDIARDSDESGSGHLGETEFNAALYYKYFSCNMEQLVKNLGGDHAVAIESLAAVLDAACRVTPSGKQNSFASHALADTVLLVLRRERIPASLANAFERSVPRSDEGYLTASRSRLARHYNDIAGSYGLHDTAILFAVAEEDRSDMAKLLPEGTRIVSSLAELFEVMRHYLNGMISVPLNGDAASASVAV